MKLFLKKVFFFDAPEKGAFWGLILLLLGTWLLGTFFFFSGFEFFIGMSFYDGKFILSLRQTLWIGAVCLVFTGLLLHFFYQLIRCFRGKRRHICSSSCIKWELLACLLGLATVLSCVYLIVLAKRNVFFDYYFCCHLFKAEASTLPCWGMVTLFLLWAAVLAAGKVLSLWGNMAYKEIFSLPVELLAAFSLIVYTALIVGSLEIRKQCDKEKLLLHQAFGRPFDIEEMKKLSRAGRNVDGAFWSKSTALIKKYEQNRHSHYCFDEFPPQQLDLWRKIFASSEEVALLEEMFSALPPAVPREFEKYRLANIFFNDISQIRALARIQVWKIRFAIEKNDRKAVMKALNRLDLLSAYFENEPVLLCGYVKIAVEGLKIRILEEVLAARILTQQDLMIVKKQLAAAREKLPVVERNCLWGESLVGVDFLEAYACAESTYDNKRIVPGRKFFFILPQLWLAYEVNRLNFLRSFRNGRKFSEVSLDSGKSTLFNFFARMLYCDTQKIGSRFALADLTARFMEFFIDQELYRLQHGFLPEKQKFPSQKGVKYTKGTVKITRGFYGREPEQITVAGRQLSFASGKNSVTVTVPDKCSFLR